MSELSIAALVHSGGEILQSAYASLKEQAKAIDQLSLSLNEDFVRAVRLILAGKGRLVISGMGKSGHIGAKMAASLASTGTRAFFVHPGEAFHGDLGMIAPEDVVLLISNSGETDEVLKLIPTLKRFGNQIIGMHGNENSALARYSDVNLLVKVDREICPYNLAPTSSTLAAMAMGDALTVALMQQRGFRPEDFAQYHPGGSLGRRLLMSVKDEMKTENLPIVDEAQLIRDCLFVMTNSRAGTAIVLRNSKLAGVLTDGDIRRALMKDPDMLQHPVADYMTSDPVTIHMDAKLSEAEEIMREQKIKVLIVLDDQCNVVGILDYFCEGSAG